MMLVIGLTGGIGSGAEGVPSRAGRHDGND